MPCEKVHKSARKPEGRALDQREVSHQRTCIQADSKVGHRHGQLFGARASLAKQTLHKSDEKQRVPCAFLRAQEMTTSWEMQMAKQRDAEKKVKEAEKKKQEEEDARKAEEDAKLGNKIKHGFQNVGQGIKVGVVRRGSVCVSHSVARGPLSKRTRRSRSQWMGSTRATAGCHCATGRRAREAKQVRATRPVLANKTCPCSLLLALCGRFLSLLLLGFGALPLEFRVKQQRMRPARVRTP